MKKIALTVIMLAMAMMAATAMTPHGETAEPTGRKGECPDKGYRHIKDIPYVSADETDTYRIERCRLDLYYPEDVEGFATLVWFHGGGLEGGSKSLLDEFRSGKIGNITLEKADD